MKVKINPKTFFIASGVITVAGAGAMYTAYAALGEMDTKVQTLRREAKDEKEVQAQLEKTGATIEQLRGKLHHLEEGVPQFAYIPSMTKELEAVGRGRGIHILGIRPMPAPTNKKDGDKPERKAYQELTIQVKGRGTFGSVMRFIQALTRFPKIVEVRMLTLSPKIDSKTPLASPLLDAEIELRAYAFKDAAPEAKAEKVAMNDPAQATAAKVATGKTVIGKKEGPHGS